MRAKKNDLGLWRDHYLATFDGWRALAALMVVYAHEVSVCRPGSRVWNDITQSNTGGFGVNIFFGLSGFLITYLMLVEKESRGAFHLGHFWIRRIFRIVPLTWFYFLTVCLLALFGFCQVAGKDLAPTALFYSNYALALHGGYSWVLRHTWTLGVEMQFYLFWSIAVWAMGCRGVAWLSLGCAVMIGLWRWYAGHRGMNIDVSRTDFRADCLFMGAFFGSIYFYAKGKCFLSKYLPPWSPFLALAALIFLVGWEPHGYLILEPIFFAALLTGTLVNASHAAFCWMEWTVFRWLGRISFSVYIWQQLFAGFGPFHSTSVTTFFLGLSAVFFLAWLSYRYIEVPGIRLGSRLIRRMEGTAANSVKAPFGGVA